MNNVVHISAPPQAPTDPAGHLADLVRLRGIGMMVAEQIGRRASGLLLERELKDLGDGDPTLSFHRISRSVRQIIVLEQELMGFRRAPTAYGCRGYSTPAQPAAAPEPEAPDDDGSEIGDLCNDLNDLLDRHDLAERDDTHDYDDYDDYDRVPVEEAIGRIRATLNALVESTGLSGAVPEPAEADSGDDDSPELQILLAELDKVQANREANGKILEPDDGPPHGPDPP